MKEAAGKSINTCRQTRLCLMFGATDLAKLCVRIAAKLLHLQLSDDAWGGALALSEADYQFMSSSMIFVESVRKQQIDEMCAKTAQAQLQLQAQPVPSAAAAAAAAVPSAVSAAGAMSVGGAPSATAAAAAAVPSAVAAGRKRVLSPLPSQRAATSAVANSEGSLLESGGDAACSKRQRQDE